jgi:hypothetical protein
MASHRAEKRKKAAISVLHSVEKFGSLSSADKGLIMILPISLGVEN